VHIIHTGLVAGWSGVMLLYELIIFDPQDPIFNPMWRQACYVMPLASRLGVCSSVYHWSVGVDSLYSAWTYELVSLSHIILCGLCILAGFWHWSNWDLDVFISTASGNLVLDLNRIFGIHLMLASLLCFGFGYAHLSGFSGPGMWTSDSFGLIGSVRPVKPFYSILGLGRFCYGAISAHHTVSGFLGLTISLWHLRSKPGPSLFKLLRISNIEAVLASSIAVVFYTTLVLASSMWYGSSSSGIELFGPSRYHWDNAYFSQDIERRINNSEFSLNARAWEQVPEKLILYDYLGCNPSKGGLFRSGPMNQGDGLVQNWLGHPSFEVGTLTLSVRRMPAFFETFPVLLIDKGGNLRADIPFRRGGSRFSIEQTQLTVYFSGGILSSTQYSTPSLIKNYARKAQFGSIFTFDRRALRSDGVFRTSSRGWYSFSHTSLGIIFIFGHLWHASRALFKQVWTGVSIRSMVQSEYGLNEKLGDTTTDTLSFI